MSIVCQTVEAVFLRHASDVTRRSICCTLFLHPDERRPLRASLVASLLLLLLSSAKRYPRPFLLFSLDCQAASAVAFPPSLAAGTLLQPDLRLLCVFVCILDALLTLSLLLSLPQTLHLLTLLTPITGETKAVIPVLTSAAAVSLSLSVARERR